MRQNDLLAIQRVGKFDNKKTVENIAKIQGGPERMQHFQSIISRK